MRRKTKPVSFFSLSCKSCIIILFPFRHSVEEDCCSKDLRLGHVEDELDPDPAENVVVPELVDNVAVPKAM